MTERPDSTAILIRALSREARPVHVIRPPLQRGLIWSAASFTAGLGLLAGAGTLDNLALLLERWTVCAQLLATVLTAVAATLAAFQLSVPGAARRWVWLPALPLGLWLASLGVTCLEDWLSAGGPAMAIQISRDCVALVLLLSLPLILGAAVLIGRAAPLEPTLEGALVALAGAATASALVQVLYPLERGVQVLLWNFGPVMALMALGGVAGAAWFASPGRNH